MLKIVAYIGFGPAIYREEPGLRRTGLFLFARSAWRVAMGQWIAVDLDGTLATWQGDGVIVGEPVPRMVERVRYWLSQGKQVKIFTARASVSDESMRERNIAAIENWCVKHIGTILPVTCQKDYDCVEIWDDKAVRVIRNTGMTENEYRKRKFSGLGERARTRRMK